MTVKRSVPGTVTIFISASVAELERRLKERATETHTEIGERLRLAREQLEQAGEFDHVIVNDELEHAGDELERVVRRELALAATIEP